MRPDGLPLSIERPETAQRPQASISLEELGLPPAGSSEPGQESITVTRAELADMVANAASAAVAAKAVKGSTPASVRSAARAAMTEVAG